MFVDAIGICFPLGLWRLKIYISWHIPASCSPRDAFPSSFGSQASTAATSRVIFLDVDGVILPAGLNLSRFKIARRVERIEEGVWVLVPSWKHVYFMVNFMHNEGCKQSQKYAKVLSFTRELLVLEWNYWGSIDMIVVDGVTLPAKSHAWGLMHLVLHPSKYKYIIIYIRISTAGLVMDPPRS